MHLFFLNAGGAVLLFFSLFLALIFTGIVTLIEAGVMTAFKYNIFRKAIADSAKANFSSLLVGLFLIFFASDLFHLWDWSGYAAFYVVNVIAEGLVLYLCNMGKPFLRTALVCLIMNIISYPVLYIFTNLG